MSVLHARPTAATQRNDVISTNDDIRESDMKTDGIFFPLTDDVIGRYDDVIVPAQKPLVAEPPVGAVFGCEFVDAVCTETESGERKKTTPK